jgi:hypothetical protein
MFQTRVWPNDVEGVTFRRVSFPISVSSFPCNILAERKFGGGCDGPETTGSGRVGDNHILSQVAIVCNDETASTTSDVLM